MGADDAGLGVDTDVAGDERLKAEAILVEGGGGIGEDTFVGGGTAAGGGPGETAEADAKPENSSPANKSWEMAEPAGFAVVTGGRVGSKFQLFNRGRPGAVAGGG